MLLCDTKYAYDEGVELGIDEIIAKVERLDCLNVCLTGGEPLLQENTRYLIDALKSAGFFVAVETNGTVDINRFANVDRFVVDYKLPSARPDVDFFQPNFAALSDEDELKFVVNDRADYETAKQVISDCHTTATKLMSPCWQTGIVRDLADWIVRDDLPVRYSLQIHKVIWGGATKSK